jgi:glycosyltransferase involved in cell wall biosynthesis
MKTSFIIPTLNRPYDLKRCLKSITELSQKPDEIIIIEQGDIAKTNTIVDKFKELLNINLCFHNVKSGAQARNVGIKKAKGDIIFFIDDDTELEKNYINVAIDYFTKTPKVVAITGSINNTKITISSFIKRLLTTMLGFNSFKNKTLRSASNGYGFFLNTKHKAQVLKGGNCAIRSLVFADGFRFNADFIRWSSGEDTMISYQIYKHYGDGSLMYLPEFKLIHYDSDEISLTNESAVRMLIIYRFIFWYKEIYQDSKFNLICYLYGQLGLIFFEIRKAKNKLVTFKYAIKSYKYLAKNWRSVANNSIDYNDFIVNSNK